VQLLEESGLDPLQKSLAEIITSCGSTLHETLTSVLSYAKINQFKRRQQEYRQSHPTDSEWALADKTRLVSSRPDPDFQGLYMRTNVAMLCEELVGVAESGRSFQSSANEEVIIVCNVSYEENWSYLTEAGALRRIVINLIGNALKYTKTGSVIVSLAASKLAEGSPEITGCDPNDRTLTFSIKDTGKGMSKSFLQDHLFVPFTQEDSTSSHGVGLGMSIVKNLVSLLGGEIQVQSKVGSGTKVDVALPMRIYDSKEDTPAESRFEQNTKTLRARNLSVIVFGFPDFARSSLETYLHEWYNCTLLEVTDNALPDIVIVDEGDEEVLERVKRTAHIYGRRAVLLSTVLVISKMVRRMDTIEGYKKWERIPRPIGPSNVAKGLLGCLPKLDELTEQGDDMESDVRDSESRMDERTEELSSNNPVGISAELPMWAFERLELANNYYSASWKEELSTPSTTANRDPPPKTTEASAGNEGSKRDSNLRILLVDDNILNLKLLRAFFRKNGYHNVQQAKHGEEAVEAFRQCTEGFDIIFMGMSLCCHVFTCPGLTSKQTCLCPSWTALKPHGRFAA
jgi:CheY-like chemotaxis protein